MSKKIAVLIRENQEEGFRMAVGAILLDDAVEVYVLDKMVEENESNKINLEALNDFDIPLFSNIKENKDLEYLSIEQIASKLADYDLVIPYWAVIKLHFSRDSKMKNLLIIIKQDTDVTLNKIIEELKKSCRVEIEDLRKNKDYDGLVDKIFNSDTVISW